MAIWFTCRMTATGRAFLIGGIVLVLVQLAVVFVLQPMQWINSDLTQVYTGDELPAGTVVVAVAVAFAALSVLFSAARRIGDPTRDFHRRHRDERLAAFTVAAVTTAVAALIVLMFVAANGFLWLSYMSWGSADDVWIIEGGLEVFFGNLALGLNLVGLAIASVTGMLVVRVVAARRGRADTGAPVSA